MTRFIISGRNLDLSFALRFLTMWFGCNTRIADISPEEFERACRVCMKVPKERIIAEGSYVQTDR